MPGVLGMPGVPGGIPRSRVLNGPLGQLPDELPPEGFDFGFKPPRFTIQEVRAGMALGAGLLSAGALILYARGRTKEASVIGAAVAITGAFFAAIRILREDER